MAPYVSEKQRRLFKACKTKKGRKKMRKKCPSMKAIRKYERHK